MWNQSYNLFSQILIFRFLLVPASSILTTTAHGDAILRSTPLDVHSVVWISNWNHPFLQSSVFLTHLRQVFTPSHLRSSGIERNGTAGSETPGKKYLHSEDYLLNICQTVNPLVVFLGCGTHHMHSLPPQFALASFLDGSNLISSLGSRRSRTMFGHCGDSARQLTFLLLAQNSASGRGETPEIPVPYGRYTTVLAARYSGKRMKSYR